MANQFDKFSQNILGSAGLGVSAFDDAKPETPKKKKAPVKKSEPAPAVIPAADQKAAVEASQSKFRLGRGVKKNNEERKLISFNLPETTIARIHELHLQLGKSKQDLYEEAFADLLLKYIDI